MGDVDLSAVRAKLNAHIIECNRERELQERTDDRLREDIKNLNEKHDRIRDRVVTGNKEANATMGRIHHRIDQTRFQVLSIVIGGGFTVVGSLAGFFYWWSGHIIGVIKFMITGGYEG